MKPKRSNRFTPGTLKGGTVLVVADFMNGSSHVLDLAGALASEFDAHLELLQVVDPGQTRPSPDVGAAARSNLEKFAHRMRAMGTGVVNLLSFGSPEDLIAKRAAAIDARLIIFPLTGSNTERGRRKLVSRLEKRCACPVVAFPLEAGDGSLAGTGKAHGPRALVHRLFGLKQSLIAVANDFDAEILPLFRGA